MGKKVPLSNGDEKRNYSQRISASGDRHSAKVHSFHDVMVSYATDALDYASVFFETNLDRSPASIRRIDRLLDRIPADELTDMKMQDLKLNFGALVGESIRTRLGGRWLMEEDMRKEALFNPALVTDTGIRFYPMDQINRRLLDPDHDRLESYYQAAISKCVAA